jgi:hypothetical protein
MLQIKTTAGLGSSVSSVSATSYCITCLPFLLSGSYMSDMNFLLVSFLFWEILRSPPPGQEQRGSRGGVGGWGVPRWFLAGGNDVVGLFRLLVACHIILFTQGKPAQSETRVKTQQPELSFCGLREEELRIQKCDCWYNWKQTVFSILQIVLILTAVNILLVLKICLFLNCKTAICSLVTPIIYVTGSVVTSNMPYHHSHEL